MSQIRLFVFVLILVFPALGWASPAFPELAGVEPEWADGPAGAFLPRDSGSSGNTWYVDGQNGLDQASGGQGDPVETIARGLELAGPGDVVLVLPGEYHEQIMPPDIAASRARPVTLRAEPADGQSVILDGSGVVLSVEGSFDLAAGVSLNRDSSFVIQGFLIRNFDGYGLVVQQSSDVQVLDCVFRDNGAGLSDSVDMLLRSASDTRVVGNVFDSGTERALDDRASDSWIALNTFSGHLANAVKLGPYPDCRGSRLEHNVFLDNPASQGVIYAGDVRGVSVRRNLVVGGNLQGLRVDGALDSRFELNTIVGFHAGIQLRDLEGCRVRGNILSSNTMGLEYLSLSLPQCVVDGNLYHDNTADVEAGSAGPNDIFGDPGFVDPDNLDYSPDPLGPAADSGPNDLPIPEGGGSRVDCGAWELGAGTPLYSYQTRFQVADLSPALLWQYLDPDPSAGQEAYRVQLDREPDFDSPQLVDSNWQNSSQGSWTVPHAVELVPGRWYVRVQLRDDQNQPSPWSDPHVAMRVDPSPGCSDQGGQGCAALDSCQGQWLPAADHERCCLGSCVQCPDADQDGFLDSACGGADCDDQNQQVNPDAQELCDNSVDDDCDQDTDLADGDCGCVDHDRDGFGQNCPAGDDCDDSIASVHPGAPELCNYVDDNCDGQTDEGVDLNSDPENCGECFWACAASELCDLGNCAGDCGGGREACDRACVDTSSDLAHCGGCDQLCELPQAGQSCSDGVCILTGCLAGYVDLNGEVLDGCEYSCSPSGDEVCANELDDNCDGQVDEGCSSGGGGCGAAGSGPAWPGWPLLFLILCGSLCYARRVRSGRT